jgi:hypothetical protein
MPFNADGSFSRVRGPDSWKDDAAATTPIRSDYHDINDQDLANGLSDTITRTGKSQPTADIPMNNHRLVNVGQPADPQDAATKRYVDEMPGWPNSKSIAGADVDGRLNFTSLTGVNGITWSSIDAAWVARKADPSGQKERNRVVLNNKADCTGTDVIAINDADGTIDFITQTVFRQNLIYDGVSYRTPTAGTGGFMQKLATGLYLWANSVATTLAYGVATVENWYSVVRSGGTVLATFNKKASGDYAGIMGQMNGAYRWLVQLGDGTPEATGDVGSNFYLTSYTNAGASKNTVMWSARSDGKVRFPQGISGVLYLDNGIDTVGAVAVLGGVGGVYLRPNGRASATGQAVVGASGDLAVDRYVIANGYAECAGTSGTPNSGQVFNFNYVDSTHINVYVGTTIVGHITPGASFDARGMIDDLMARVAALETALQDAQTRIAALEARP